MTKRDKAMNWTTSTDKRFLGIVRSLADKKTNNIPSKLGSASGSTSGSGTGTKSPNPKWDKNMTDAEKDAWKKEKD